MAANSASEWLLRTKFESDECMKDLNWLYEPAKYEYGATDQGGLLLHMDAKTDYWRRTYYKPEMINDNGHLLYKNFSLADKVVMETSFDLNTASQFDQAGLMLRLDEDHWIKTGLEYSDGQCCLSVVVTNYNSDWSTQVWPASSLSVRLYMLQKDVVVEAKSLESDEWNFIRITRIDTRDYKGGNDVKLGLLACAPTASGGRALFHNFSIKPCEGYSHTN